MDRWLGPILPSGEIGANFTANGKDGLNRYVVNRDCNGSIPVPLTGQVDRPSPNEVRNSDVAVPASFPDIPRPIGVGDRTARRVSLIHVTLMKL